MHKQVCMHVCMYEHSSVANWILDLEWARRDYGLVTPIDGSNVQRLSFIPTADARAATFPASRGGSESLILSKYQTSEGLSRGRLDKYQYLNIWGRCSEGKNNE